jgi:hypothetical protein
VFWPVKPPTSATTVLGRFGVSKTQDLVVKPLVSATKKSPVAFEIGQMPQVHSIWVYPIVERKIVERNIVERNIV